MMMTAIKSIKFEAVTGVNPGYGHENMEQNPLELVGRVWQEIAEEEFQKSGIYVSANITPSKTIYSANWGCPVAGEDTVKIEGTMNPQFTKDELSWKQAVIRTVKELKRVLEQSTIVLEFKEVDEFIYLT